MPSHVERLCFTLWMSDKWGPHAKRGSPSASQILRRAQETCADHGGSLPEQAAQDLLSNPEIQKLASKLRFANDWAESIRVSSELRNLPPQSKPQFRDVRKHVGGNGKCFLIGYLVASRELH